jgi:uncharacterized membrane protein
MMREMRVETLDVLRGLAIAQMVLWHITHYLGKANLYWDAPYFLASLDMPLVFSVVILFLSVSGASLYLSYSRRLERGVSRLAIGRQILKRYGGLILISLIFTPVMWDFCTFFRWDEAIQGIGLTALVTFGLIVAVRSHVVLLGLTAALIALQPYLWTTLRPATLTTHPMCPPVGLSLWSSLLLNVTFRGFFSISNLLPLMILGAVLASSFVRWGREKNFLGRLGLTGLALIGCSLLLHVLGFGIDFYLRSYPSLLLEMGIFLSLFAVIECSLRKRWSVCKPFAALGRRSLFIYLGHFVAIVKPVQLLGVEGALPTPVAGLIALAVLIGLCGAMGWVRRSGP